MIRRVIKFGLLASALVGGGLLALGTTARETIDGSGVPATEPRDVGDVTEVVLSGVGDLTIVPGDFPTLSVTADDNVLPAVQEKFAATYKAAGGECELHVFEGSEHQWVAEPGPQTDRARAMVKAFIARQMRTQ